jgi:hypothetical protein
MREMRIPVHIFSLALFPSRLFSLSSYCVQKSPTLKQHASQIIVHCCINNCMGIQKGCILSAISHATFSRLVLSTLSARKLVKHLQKFHQTALLSDSPSIHDDAQCTEQPEDDVHFSGGDMEEEPRSLGPSTCAGMPHFEELIELIVDPHTDLDHILPEDNEPVEEFVPLEAEPDNIVCLRYTTTENVFLSVGLNLYLLIVSQFSYYAGVCCL